MGIMRFADLLMADDTGDAGERGGPDEEGHAGFGCDCGGTAEPGRPDW
jgi:hypothetical protein